MNWFAQPLPDDNGYGPPVNFLREESMILPTLAVAFAAFCVWLTIRIVNRRERWAKWTAIWLAIALGYPLSLGPACWITSHLDCGGKAVSILYRPLAELGNQWGGRGHLVPELFWRYSDLFAARGWYWAYSNRHGHSWEYEFGRESRFRDR